MEDVELNSYQLSSNDQSSSFRPRSIVSTCVPRVFLYIGMCLFLFINLTCNNLTTRIHNICGNWELARLVYDMNAEKSCAFMRHTEVLNNLRNPATIKPVLFLVFMERPFIT